MVGRGQQLPSYRTNVCKIPRLRVAISLLASDESLSNLASILTLRRSFQRCWRTSPNDPHQYLKKKKESCSHVSWPRWTDVCWMCSVKFCFFLKSNVFFVLLVFVYTFRPVVYFAWVKHIILVSLRDRYLLTCFMLVYSIYCIVVSFIVV